MIRRLLVIVPALALLGACVGDDSRRGYNGGGIYQPDYKERRDDSRYRDRDRNDDRRDGDRNDRRDDRRGD